MKIFLVILFAVGALSVSAQAQSEFERGFEQGFEQGKSSSQGDSLWACSVERWGDKSGKLTSTEVSRTRALKRLLLLCAKYYEHDLADVDCGNAVKSGKAVCKEL